jgi:serine phosphatase RsbU (regulator of sigma subunit)
LGAVSDPDLKERSVILGQGDALVLVTDGVLDAGAPDNPIDEAGLLEVIGSCRYAPASEIAGTIERRVESAWQDGARDDCAILVMRWFGTSARVT